MIDCSGCPLDDPAAASNADNFRDAISHARALSVALDLRSATHLQGTRARSQLLTAVQLIEEALIRLRRADEIAQEVTTQ